MPIDTLRTIETMLIAVPSGGDRQFRHLYTDRLKQCVGRPEGVCLAIDLQHSSPTAGILPAVDYIHNDGTDRLESSD